MVDRNIRKIADDSLALSIIVPVYNVEPWLSRCLDSLLGQTIKNIEIICIDDKSSDSSLKILREYEKKDNRIKVIAQEKNGGVSVARNTGLAIAAGEYIGFADSDDFVDSDFYEKLYERAMATDANITKGDAFIIDNENKRTLIRPCFEDIRKNKANFYYPLWAAIYKHDFIKKNKLDFPVGVIISEDVTFLTKAVILANRIELVEGTYYNYIRRENSLDSIFFSVEKLKSNVKSSNIIIDFINENAAGEREVYSAVSTSRLQFMLYSCGKACSFDGHLIAIRGAIELYKKCKYKDDLNKVLGENQAKFLSEGNEVALSADLLGRARKVVNLKLFNFVSLLKIIHRYEIVEVILFCLIPLLRISKKYDGDYYYLFFCIPIMKKVTNK